MKEGAGDMRKKLNDRDARCPFFLAHTEGCIYCESPLPGCFMSLRFATEEGKRTQYKAYCCRKYEKCEIYRANMEKYEEDE